MPQTSPMSWMMIIMATAMLSTMMISKNQFSAKTKTMKIKKALMNSKTKKWKY